MGMVNQLGKFSPCIAELSQPIRELLKKDTAWVWGEQQQLAFDSIKRAVTGDTCLALYDPAKPTKVSADASSYGLGAVISQMQDGGVWRPVAFQSRALSDTEQRYAQIEKEALAVTWACERFEDYLLGKDFCVETDHKPLVPLLSSKQLDVLPPRVLRFRHRMMRFRFSIQHVPGKELIIPDTLSRAPVGSCQVGPDVSLSEDADHYLASVIAGLPATDRRLEELCLQQDEDDCCALLKQYVQNGWPPYADLKGPIRAYHQYASQFTLSSDGLLLMADRIVVPAASRMEILHQLHNGHQGITKSQRRAQASVWWPGLSTQIAEYIGKCAVCARTKVQHPEPLQPSTLPEYPWQKVGSDLFEFRSVSYLLVVDYYSRWIEIAKLSSTTSSSVISHFKSIFAKYGIPEVVVSDNGPQFSSHDFRAFSSDYGFVHCPSSPIHPEGNGLAERAVRIVKDFLRSSADPYQALLAYRSTPLENGYSPSQLLMGRRLRSLMPAQRTTYYPAPVSPSLAGADERLKLRQKKNHDDRFASTPLPVFSPGQRVWIPDRNESGTVQRSMSPRSYSVCSESNMNIRRNRVDLKPLPQSAQPVSSADEDSPVPLPDPTESSSPSLEPLTTSPYKTRSGRAVKLPVRYRD